MWDLRQRSHVFSSKKMEDYVSKILTNENAKHLVCVSGEGCITSFDIAAKCVHIQVCTIHLLVHFWVKGLQVIFCWLIKTSFSHVNSWIFRIICTGLVVQWYEATNVLSIMQSLRQSIYSSRWVWWPFLLNDSIKFFVFSVVVLCVCVVYI